MSLKDLARHIDIQNRTITRLHPTAIESDTPTCESWDKFRKDFWGKDLDSLVSSGLVRRGKDRGKEDILPEKPPSVSKVVKLPNLPPGVWTLTSKSFLVRSEYYVAEQTAVKTSTRKNRQLFLVNGTPGIGKSVFLLWLLIRRLALELPTILHADDDYPILFHQGGVLKLTALTQPRLYDVLATEGSKRIWVLFDANTLIPQPVGIFRHNSPCFIVQACSPRSEYHEWHKKLAPEVFYMNPWSFSEVIQAHPLLDPDATERQLWHLYHEFGVSPGDLTRYSTCPDSYMRLLSEEINGLDPGVLPRIFKKPGSHPTSQFILTIYPLPDDRSEYTVAPASRRVFELLWDKHFRSRLDDMEYFYDLFQGSTVTSASAAAGWIFELRMHELLLGKRRLQLFPIRCADVGKVNLIYSNYTATKERKGQVEFELKKLRKSPFETILQANHYYCFDSCNFPTVDSLLLIYPPGEASPILLMFKIISSWSRHDVEVGGLHEVDGLQLPSNVRKYYVVVTPKGIQPTITVPVEYFPRTKRGEVVGSPDVVLPVFHFPVPRRKLFPSRG